MMPRLTDSRPFVDLSTCQLCGVVATDQVNVFVWYECDERALGVADILDAALELSQRDTCPDCRLPLAAHEHCPTCGQSVPCNVAK